MHIAVLTYFRARSNYTAELGMNNRRTEILTHAPGKENPKRTTFFHTWHRKVS